MGFVKNIIAGSVLNSVSRNAGGLFESVRCLNLAMQKEPLLNIRVIGIQDEFTAQDSLKWNPIEINISRPFGPRRFGFSFELYDQLVNSNLDILHVHGIWQYQSIAVSKWARRIRRPYIISPHGMIDSWAILNSKWKKRLALALYESTHLKNATCIRALCVSEAESIRTLGLKNPIAIIPNGIDSPSEIHGNPPWQNTVEPGRRILLFLGRIHPKKNLLNLLKAWAMYINNPDSISASNWTLAIAGWDDGGYASVLEKAIIDLNLNDHVITLGPLFGNEKALAYKNADAFVLPSFSEGLPMTVLEAWSYGVPVLMSEECNLPEGFEFKAAKKLRTDVDGMASDLGSYLSMDKDVFNSIGINGIKLVQMKFSWPEISNQMLDLYRWILFGGDKPETVILD